MRPRCMTVAATLSARGEDGLTESMRRHCRDCARCRTDLADHAAYREAIAGLAQVEYLAPTGIVPRVMAGVGPWVVPAPVPAVAHRVRVAAAAIATAAATATAGTLVAVRMHRHRTA